ncbi:ribosome biogenesis protein YTM1 [Angomonas deanei]|nr:ribosome biogenesis protein YTM1 [Angomonas deanei]|eukprot:EPY24988.1 ribosome biogenesis protein YTM1 [Angomonas deanei]
MSLRNISYGIRAQCSALFSLSSTVFFFFEFSIIVRLPMSVNPTSVQNETADTMGNAAVSFFTTTFQKHMPEQVFSVPLSTLPNGLNALVRSVLELPESQSFDFLLNDEYITSTLQRFLHRRSISYETVLHIEYTPALQTKEGSLLPHDDWVSSVRAPFFGNSDVVVTGAYDHCVRLWEGENCSALGTYHKECVKEVAIHPVKEAADSSKAGAKRKRVRGELDNVFVASCSKDGSVAGWKYDAAVSKFELLGTIFAHTDGIDTVHISPFGGEFIVTGSWDNSVKIFNWSQLIDGGDTLPSKKQPNLCFTDHSRSVLCCRFSETHRSHCYSAGLDGVVKAYDVGQGQLFSQFSGDHSINKIALRPSSGSDLLLTACTDNRARLYDTREKECTKTFSGHRQWLYSVCWLWGRDQQDDQKSNLFSTCSEDATVRVYDLRSTSGPLLTLDTIHTDGVLDVTCAGNDTIVSCGKDNKTKASTISKDSH